MDALRIVRCCLALSAWCGLAACGLYQTAPLLARDAADFSIAVDWQGGQLTFALEPLRPGTCRALASDANITLNGVRMQVTAATFTDTGCTNNRLAFEGTLDVRDPLVLRLSDDTGMAEFVTTHPRAPRSADLVAPEDGHLRPGEPVRFVWTPASDELEGATFLIQTARSGPHRVELQQGGGGVLTGVQPDLSWLPTQEASTQVLAQGRGGVIRCTFGRCVAPPVFAGPPAFMMTVGQ